MHKSRFPFSGSRSGLGLGLPHTQIWPSTSNGATTPLQRALPAAIIPGSRAPPVAFSPQFLRHGRLHADSKSGGEGGRSFWGKHPFGELGPSSGGVTVAVRRTWLRRRRISFELLVAVVCSNRADRSGRIQDAGQRPDVDSARPGHRCGMERGKRLLRAAYRFQGFFFRRFLLDLFGPWSWRLWSERGGRGMAASKERITRPEDREGRMEVRLRRPVGFKSRSFRPARWGQNPHVQTIVGSWLPPVPDTPYQRVRLETKDGDFIDVDEIPGTENPRTAVVMCHGLQASSSTPQSRRISAALHAKGWSVYAMNLRGRSGVPNRHLPMYHLGFTDDMRLVVEHAKRKGADRIYLCGYSLGGNIAIKLLGELGDSAHDFGVYGGMAFSVPFGCNESSYKLTKGFTKFVYARMFLRSLKESATRLYQGHADEFKRYNIDYRRLLESRSIREFDEEFTCKLYNFHDAQDYYTQADSKPFLRRVRVPLLVINAIDDPLIDAASRPTQEDLGGAPVTLYYTEKGGHCGFMEDIRGPSYTIQELTRFLETLEKEAEN